MRTLTNIYHLIESWLFTLIYGMPIKRFKTIFVTGTDGKTTTSTFIYNILNAAGKKAGLISTVAAYVGNESLDTGLHTTTPSKSVLQKALSKMAQATCEYVVIEITAHGIDQHRIVGTKPEVSVFTNVTSEHLDYAGTLENLIEMKGRIIKFSGKSFFNAKDASTKHLIQIAKSTSSPYDLYTTELVKSKLSSSWGLKFPGEYNFENASAAYIVAKHLGISDDIIINALENAVPPVGRFAKVENNLDLNIYIDFAHTPNALKEVLTAAKNLFPDSRLISVFGCAGLRDTAKRPVMGEHAKSIADLVVITAEDPRTENVNEICAQIAAGCKKVGGVENSDYFIKPDRTEAIDFAITKLAQKNDTILITGKAHEKSMCYGTTEYPWSDFDAVKKIIMKGN